MSEAIKNEETLETAQTAQTLIGTCVNCGIAVTNENLGQKSPKVMCSACVEAENEAKRRQEEARLHEIENEKRRMEADERSARTSSIIRLVLSNVVGFGIMGVMFALGYEHIEDLTTALVGYAFLSTYIASLFYPGSWTRGLFVNVAFKGFQLPFVFELSLDGCLMFIVFKLLGWLLGILLGIAGFVLAIIVGVLISPFVYIYYSIKYIVAIVKGEYVTE